MAKKVFHGGIIALCSLTATGAASAEHDWQGTLSKTDNYLTVAAGRFNAKESSGALKNPENGLSLYAAGMVPSTHTMTYGIFLHIFTSEYDTPSHITSEGFTVVDSTSRITTTALGLLAEWSPSTPTSTFFAGGGTGLYFSEMTLTASQFGIPVSATDSSTSLGFDLHVGVQIAIGEERSLRIELRRVELSGSFGDYTRGDVDIGGNFIHLGVSF